MAFAFFIVPIQDEGGQAAKELNQFLASHRVVSIERSLIEQGSNSRWSFCIEYSAAVSSKEASSSTNRTSVDYKAILPAEEFQWYSQLRDWRSTLAKTDSIPPYLIFNNQQLVQIIQERMTTNGFRGFSITRGSRDLESRESWGPKGRKRSREDSRRQSESGSDGESLRREKLAKHWENKGQKREQADVLRRRPVGITRGSN